MGITVMSHEHIRQDTSIVKDEDGTIRFVGRLSELKDLKPGDILYVSPADYQWISDLIPLA